ncbi:glycosyltransferase family 4 protein [Methanothrix sp.]|uniref:glycosyltransferase family 4 protein n=1 Tax=Methanothrix sp. TaxID=90426 RepID=UPI003BB5F5D0
MRILVVQESDWIARGPHQSHHLMERLSKRGHEIRVIDFEILWRENDTNSLVSKLQVFEGVHKAINDGSVTVIRPPIIRLPVLDYISLIYTHNAEIKRQIDEFKPDVVIAFGILNANVAFRIAKKKGIPSIYYIIDELHRLVPEKAFKALAKFIERQNMKIADKVISINEGLREYTIQMGAAEEKTEVIRAGVDLERFVSDGREEIRKRYGILDDDIVLFFMGWLYDFSGLKEVALELARNENDNIKLMVVGKGDLGDALQEIRKNFGLENKLILVDWIPYEDVPKYLSAADICILPAYNNDIMRNIVPIKMYEYMAAKKTVIATRIYGIMKEFGDNNGVLYVDKPEEVVSNAIRLAESNGSIEEEQKARNFVDKLSWSRIVDSFEGILVGV